MFTVEDISRFRAETPGVGKVIHFNNAGSALPPAVVTQSVLKYLEEESLEGGYEVHEKYFDEIEGIYDSIATLINADSSEIAVLENATMAWNTAFHSIDFKDGDEILICQAEYSSNYLSYLHLKSKVDIVVKVVPNDEHGQIDVEALDAMITDRSRLISLVHIPTNSGLVSPAEAVGDIAQKYDLLYLLDACQSVGQVPIDVDQIGCDMLSATGRKYLRGPRGTGFLFVSSRVMEQLRPPYIDLHAADWVTTNTFELRADARRFENWESNFAAILGLKKAVDYINTIGVERIWARVELLGAYLRTQLGSLDKVQVYDEGEVKGGIVSFSVDGFTAAEVKTHLRSKGINISWMGQPNARLDMEMRNISEVARASVHYYNTEIEVDTLVKEIGLL